MWAGMHQFTGRMAKAYRKLHASKLCKLDKSDAKKAKTLKRKTPEPVSSASSSASSASASSSCSALSTSTTKRKTKQKEGPPHKKRKRKGIASKSKKKKVGDAKASASKRKHKRQAKANRSYRVRKNRTAWMFFYMDFTAQLKKAKKISKMTEGSKLAGKRWKEMDDGEREQWTEKAMAEKEMYDKLCAEIKEHGDWDKIPEQWRKVVSAKAKAKEVDRSKPPTKARANMRIQDSKKSGHGDDDSSYLSVSSSLDDDSDVEVTEATKKKVTKPPTKYQHRQKDSRLALCAFACRFGV